MAREIGAGIYQLKLPLPWAVDLMPFASNTINVYLVQSGHRLMLVDSGLNDAACREKLRSEMKYLGFEISQLTDLVATHCHPDHIGLLDELAKAAPQARVHLHPQDQALIQNRYFRPQQALTEFKHWLHGHGLPSQEEIELSAIRLEVGQFSDGPACQPLSQNRINELDLDGQAWQLIWTPGHTPGHLVLYKPADRLLLVGDHLFATSSPNISKFPGSSQNPLEDYLQSLNLLANLAVDGCWPGHGEPIEELGDRIRKIERQHKRKLVRLVDTLRNDTLTAFEIANRLWGEAKLDLDSNSRRLALTETMALLEWLSQQGYFRPETDTAGVTRYSANSGRPVTALTIPAGSNLKFTRKVLDSYDEIQLN